MRTIVWTGSASNEWANAANWASAAFMTPNEVRARCDFGPPTGNPPNAWTFSFPDDDQPQPTTAYMVSTGSSATITTLQFVGRLVTPNPSVIEYTLPQPINWSRWIIFALAVGMLAAAIWTYLH